MNLRSIAASIILVILLSSCAREYIYEPSEEVIQAEIQVHKVISGTEQIIYEKYGMRPMGTGIGMPSGVIHNVGLSFDTKETLAKEEIRKLLVEFAQIMLNEFTANAEIQPLLVQRPASLDNVQIIIFNYSKNRELSHYPNVSTANISHGILNYSYIDGEGVYMDSKQDSETFEEALQVL